MAFVRAIETREQPVTDAREGLNVLRVIEAAQSSMDDDGRTVELTAEPLAQALRLPVTVEPRLGERHFGRFQGHTADEIAARWPDDFQRWRQRDPDWPIPEGESGAIFGLRVLDALADLCACHAGGRVAVIAHGGTLDVAYRAAMALSWDAPRQHVMLNASVNRVRAEGQPPRLQVIDWGDVAHLDGARDELAGG